VQDRLHHPGDATMTCNVHPLTVTRRQITSFLDVLACLRAGGRAEELALISGGWRAERARIQRIYAGCAGAFFGLFFLAGCAFLVLLAWALLLDWRANHRYLPNSCVVLDSKLAITMKELVVRVGGDDAIETKRVPVYHPEIQIRYEVDGRKYEVWTYDAVARVSTDRAAQQAIVDGFQLGATYPCWYDPDRPDRAILVRGHAWGLYYLLIGPILFLLVGGAGIHHSWKKRGRTAEPPGLERTPQAGRGALVAGPDLATVPALDLSQSPGSTLTYRLPSSTQPGRNLLGCLFSTLYWSGVAAPVAVIVIAGWFGVNWAQPGPPWPIELIVSLFALAGLVAIVFLIYFGIAELLVAIGVGPTTVEISRHPLEPGARCEVFLAQGARRTMRINRLQVACVCEEQAACSNRNGAAKTETRRVYEREVLAREQFTLQPALPLEARAELRVPDGAMHSFQTAHNRVRWKLIVQGDIAGWPDFEREFPIVVHPSKGTPK
jgi:hypothetical protein